MYKLKIVKTEQVNLSVLGELDYLEEKIKKVITTLGYESPCSVSLNEVLKHINNLRVKLKHIDIEDINYSEIIHVLIFITNIVSKIFSD